MIFMKVVLGNFLLNDLLELIRLGSVKWLQIIPYNTNYSFWY